MTREPQPSAVRDPFLLAVVANQLDSVTEEMGIRLVRSSSSMLIRNALDFTTGFCDARGGLVSLGPGIPMNMAAVTAACREAVALSKAWKHGDIYLLNDPYGGGTHLNDIFLIAPVLRRTDGLLLGFVVVAAHMTDIGGIAPGSMNFEAAEIYQEGLRLPPMYLRNGGEFNSDLLAIMEANVRYPKEFLADIEAMVVAVDQGMVDITGLIKQQVRPSMDDCIQELNAQSASATDRWLRGLAREHSAKFEDYIDANGPFSGATIRVVASVEQGALLLDFTGSSPQVPAAINAPLAFTRSCAAIAVRCAMEEEQVRLNEGFLSRVRVIAPEASVVNARLPASCGHRGITGYRVFDAVLGALSGLGAPVRAAGEGGTASCMLEGVSNEGAPFAARIAFLGAWGGGPGRDGVEGITNPCANLANIPVELLEQRFPLRFRRYGFLADSEGAGAYRGGLSTEVVFEFIGNKGSIDVRCDRTHTAPYGLEGGEPGSTASARITRASAASPLVAGRREGLKNGDVIRLRLASGGGFGDPKERDTWRLQEDVVAGKVSAKRARVIYGAVVEPGSRVTTNGSGSSKQKGAGST